MSSAGVPPAPPDAPYLTYGEAAAHARVTERTMRLWVQRGLLPRIKVTDGKSGTVRIRRADLDRLMTPR